MWPVRAACLSSIIFRYGGTKTAAAGLCQTMTVLLCSSTTLSQNINYRVSRKLCAGVDFFNDETSNAIDNLPVEALHVMCLGTA